KCRGPAGAAVRRLPGAGLAWIRRSWREFMVLWRAALAPGPVRCCNRGYPNGIASMRRLRPAYVLALPCALLLAAAPLAAQQVYKWKDANGVTQYTSSPP